MRAHKCRIIYISDGLIFFGGGGGCKGNITNNETDVQGLVAATRLAGPLYHFLAASTYKEVPCQGMRRLSWVYENNHIDVSFIYETFKRDVSGTYVGLPLEKLHRKGTISMVSIISMVVSNEPLLFWKAGALTTSSTFPMMQIEDEKGGDNAGFGSGRPYNSEEEVESFGQIELFGLAHRRPSSKTSAYPRPHPSLSR
ncbi:hypothetical protein F5B19DRAFT_187119 [Rostrohypoxylon terebratum]|nr:hypothetical protein F5B19DRAFT_187119 [Rostrohypoxylon terebratum]